MSENTLSILWKITRLAAFVLLCITIGLVIKASTSSEIEVTGYIAGTGSTTYLRAQPDGKSRIIAIIERETAVSIASTRIQENQTWYYVKVGAESGWVPADYISLDPP